MEYNIANFDPFFESDAIFKLDESNFKEFLWAKDLVMVMFYDTCNPSSYALRKYYASAAANTDRPNTGFASVNCSEEPDLCYMEKACKTPVFKLYSGTEAVGVIRNIQEVNSHFLRNYIQVAPGKGPNGIRQ